MSRDLARILLIGVAYLAAYVALDWISYVQPFNQFGITPWNPQTGLSFALILILGRRFLPLLFVAPLLADLVVRGGPAPLPLLLVLSLITGAGYTIAALALLSPRSRFQPALNRLRDVGLLLMIAAVGAAGVAVLYVAFLAATSLIAWSDFAIAARRLWIGDLIGVAVVTPWFLLIAGGRRPAVTWETLAQFAAMWMALDLIFLGTPTPQLHRFYLLFLPIIWIALQSGLPGASTGLLVTQLALMFVIEVLAPGQINTTIYQEMMLILTLTGLAAGGVVMEREQAEYRLRLQQDAHARLTRLGSINELSAGIVHEINQPLSAAATYTRLLSEELGAPNFPLSEAQRSAEKANAQVQRAAGVVQRLRDLIQTGQSEPRTVDVNHLLGTAVEVVEPELRRAGASIALDIQSNLPQIRVDVLQIEQVVINLLRNATEAIAGAGHSQGLIVMGAERFGDDGIKITVGDSGPGFDTEQIDTPFTLFHTSKQGGLGVGLNLCQTIVEQHGGRIWLAHSDKGGEVHFTLPVDDRTPP